LDRAERATSRCGRCGWSRRRLFKDHEPPLVVTDRNRPGAELGPPATTGADLDRLIAAGWVARPIRRGLPGPLKLDGDPYELSRAISEIRGER
jgi:hypothetical protein